MALRFGTPPPASGYDSKALGPGGKNPKTGPVYSCICMTAQICTKLLFFTTLYNFRIPALGFLLLTVLQVHLAFCEHTQYWLVLHGRSGQYIKVLYYNLSSQRERKDDNKKEKKTRGQGEERRGRGVSIKLLILNAYA